MAGILARLARLARIFHAANMIERDDDFFIEFPVLLIVITEEDDDYSLIIRPG